MDLSTSSPQQVPVALPQPMTGLVQESLDQQVRAVFEGMGLSGHTFNTYSTQANLFARYCHQQHRCTTLDQCRAYADEWLESRSHLSRYTQVLAVSALAKLYGESSADFVHPGRRSRDDIRRSRGRKVRDAFFSEERNPDFVDFCRGTGLTRSELESLTGDQLRIEGDQVYIEMPCRKGQCMRKVPVIGNVARIVEMMQAAGTGKVFKRIFVAADIQSYRADYARALYKMHARDLETCKKSPFTGNKHSSGQGYSDCVYWLRGSRKGEWLDKQAMKIATDALGLRHFKSFGENYLR
ncbi:MAG: hypothetical protein IKI30_08285 [Oxalobacter sp.]|nr:hypothetical protein [Oxalobacter sp.]